MGPDLAAYSNLVSVSLHVSCISFLLSCGYVATFFTTGLDACSSRSLFLLSLQKSMPFRVQLPCDHGG